MTFDALIGIILIILGAGSFFEIGNALRTQLRDRTAAAEIVAVANSAQKYLDNNSASITAALSVGHSIAIPITNASTFSTNFPSVESGGYLTKNFQGVDPYGQSYALIVSEPAASSYDAEVVSYGGKSISNSELSKISYLAGFGSAFISEATDGTTSGTLSTASGQLTLQTSILSNNSGGVPVSFGHYVMRANFSPVLMTSLSNYLNRYNTGNLSDNTLQTSVQMNDKSLSNVNSLSFSSGGAINDNGSGSLSITGSQLQINGNFGSTGVLSVGGSQSIAGQSTVAGSKTIVGSQVVASSLTSPFVGFGQNVVGNGATIGAACSPAGTVTSANDGSSSIVGCTNNVWTKLGTSGGSGGLSNYISLGCGTSVTWTNNGSGPAVIYINETGHLGDGTAYSASATDGSSNVTSVAQYAYGQGFGWIAGSGLLVPAGSTYSATTGGYACFAGWQ